ncbi:hypothetical protein [Tuberibacillus sp. Marseille-P3662]|uniref:hypothetical protein n=1 Tax=Tuberibacillus sp. Marseille-P3662 TaxID=1965358 RepID=UPI000A1CCA0D|nr:hypothetical protein [Tuberibacillus sp. Marseille-P3662]
MDKRTLRKLWMAPLVVLILLDIGLIGFTVLNIEGLKAIRELGIFIIMISLLSIWILVQSLMIMTWIKQGKL